MIFPAEGVLAGAAHVVSGADHVASVAPLAAQGQRVARTLRVGMLWGAGHALGIVILGLLGRWLLTAAGLEVASAWAETLVGFVLIAFGLLTLLRLRTPLDEAQANGSLRRPARAAAFMGVLHGVAGGHHFWGVLPSLALDGWDLVTYFAGYFLATVLAMALLTGSIGMVARRSGPRAHPLILGIAGCASLVTGVFWLAV